MDDLSNQILEFKKLIVRRRGSYPIPFPLCGSTSASASFIDEASLVSFQLVEIWISFPKWRSADPCVNPETNR